MTDTQIYLDEDIVKPFSKICNELGISVQKAVNCFAKGVIEKKTIPYELYFNEETLTAMQEANDITTGKLETKKFHSANEMFEELDKVCES